MGIAHRALWVDVALYVISGAIMLENHGRDRERVATVGLLLIVMVYLEIACA